MIYSEFGFLYPPRPEHCCSVEAMARFEERGWVAQAKKNGTCNVIAVSPEGEIHAMTRYRSPHRLWAPNSDTKEDFAHLSGGWYVFVAELLHGAPSGKQNVNYVYDVLVAEGRHLVGETQEFRQDLLLDLLDGDDDDGCRDEGLHRVVTPTLWLPTEYENNFSKLFDLMGREDSGLVLKDPNQTLSPCSRSISNVSGLVTCELPLGENQIKRYGSMR